MDCKERGSHARGVYPTVYLAHGNSKGEGRGRSRHKNNSMKYGRKEREHEGEKSQTRPNYC